MSPQITAMAQTPPNPERSCPPMFKSTCIAVKGTPGLLRQRTQGTFRRPHPSPNALSHLSLEADPLSPDPHRSLPPGTEGFVPGPAHHQQAPPTDRSQPLSKDSACKGAHLVQVIEHSGHFLDSAHDFLRIIGIFLAAWDAAVQCHLPAKRWRAFHLRGVRTGS